MRKELTEIQLIEHYILGKLEPELKAKVEAKIKADPTFAKKVEQQNLIMEAAKNSGYRNSTKKAKSKFKLNKMLKVMLPIIAVAGIGTYLALNSTSIQSENENIRYAQNENGEETWAEADIHLKPQFFEINANEDNVITGEDGTILAIPKNAFLDVNGQPIKGTVEVELKEAIKPEDIILAGLSTKSGDDLLETGGMFYVNARQDGKSVAINPDNPIVADVPTNEVKDDMQLYDGVRKEDGNIDWQNPVELVKDLTTVDIHSLNFYPEKYLPIVASLGHAAKSKSWKDSLYYSFAGTPTGYSNGPIQGRMTVKHAKELGYDINTVEGEEKMNAYSLEELLMLGLTTKVNQGGFSILGYFNRWYQTAEGPDYSEEYQTTYFDPNHKCESCFGARDYVRGIDPAKIQGIWNEKFQNTLLATKEFEERLQAIFNNCNDELLDLYINNLDKNLWEIDKMAGDLLGGTKVYKKIGALKFTDSLAQTGNVFYDFAAQKKGKVAITNEAMQLLQNYYTQTSKAAQLAAQSTQEKFWKEYDSKRNELGEISQEEVKKDYDNYIDAYYEELNINIQEVAKQLGIPQDRELRPEEVRARGYVAVVDRFGWANIDREIQKVLVKRETFEYTHANGKTAKIEYSPFKLEVTNENEFDRLLVYLLPKEISTYQRILKKEENFYTENLNELIQYNLLVVGIKGEEISIAELNNIQSGQESVTLKASSKERLNALLSEQGKGNTRGDIVGSVVNQMKAIALQKDITQFEDQIKFRTEIAKAIFPCYDYYGVAVEVTDDVQLKTR